MTRTQGRQLLRAFGIFWLILLSCSIVPVAVITIPLLLLALRSYFRNRKICKAEVAALRREAEMMRYARAMRGWS